MRGLWQSTTGAFRLPTPCSGFRGRNILPLLEVLPRPYATEGSCYPEPKPEEDEATIARFADFVLRNDLDRKAG